MKKIYLGLLAGLLLFVAAGCQISAPTNTVTPAKLTENESKLVNALAGNAHVFDLDVAVENEVTIELWIDFYQDGQQEKLSQLTIRTDADFRGLVAVAKTSLPEDEELWRLILDGGSSTFVRPQLATATSWTWGALPDKQELEFDEPVLLAYMFGSSSGSIMIPGSIFHDQAAIDETIDKYNSYLIYLQVTEN